MTKCKPGGPVSTSAKWGVHILHTEIGAVTFAYFAYYLAYFAYYTKL
jgi:hypothetical protein